MTKENKDYGKSVKAKFLNLSKAEGLPYQPLLIRYVQERLLYRLAKSRYKHRFYLKGGAFIEVFNGFILQILKEGMYRGQTGISC
ncbi:hypothetical protein [Parabacteroides pacaensis]|uniref:hypothetical protein n=1 Tax=Parabacteroides pacaensis TaxID=2086575 RepID=UPI001F1CE790|nr:hypothetical protein [Parabacteroides pacaensis]